MRVGETVTLSNMVVTVRQVDNQGRAMAAAFCFSSPLESDEWIWVQTEGAAYARWRPPKVGQTLVLKGPPALEGMLFKR